MKLIIAIGNPGDLYKRTRHNVGFSMIEELKDFFEGDDFKMKNEALISQFFYNNKEKVLLVKPQTFVNESGRCVLYLMKYFKISEEELLVIYDDINLPVKKVRFRESGSSGGHNGLKSIIEKINSDKFGRIKIGVDHNKQIPLNHWVVDKVNEEDWNNIMSVKNEVQKLVIQWLNKKN